MAKVFDFQMSVIYVMSKSTIWIASTTTTAYFKYITQLWNWVKTIFVQNKKICQFVKYLADQTPYASNEIYGNWISGSFLQVPLFTSHIHKDSTQTLFTGWYCSHWTLTSLCPFNCWILTVIYFRIFYPNGSPCLVLKLLQSYLIFLRSDFSDARLLYRVRQKCLHV